MDKETLEWFKTVPVHLLKAHLRLLEYPILYCHLDAQADCDICQNRIEVRDLIRAFLEDSDAKVV